MPNSAPENRKPGWRSVLLGVFVLFQVVYLPLANLIQLVPREIPVEKGELDIHIQREGKATDLQWAQRGINGLGSAIDRWGEMSGQVQAWKLFAEFETQSVFPIVDCITDDGKTISRMPINPEYFPSDPAHYFRWPGARSRLASYSFLLADIYGQYNPESLKTHGDQWRDAVFQDVRRQQRSLEAYFRFALKRFHELNPAARMPGEMILRVLVIPSPTPGSSTFPGRFTVPLARWVPHRAPKTGS